jgi:hypothetical protein
VALRRVRGGARRLVCRRTRGPATRTGRFANLGPPDEIEGYAGQASVLPGEPFPLFVSTTSRGFRVSGVPDGLVRRVRRPPGVAVRPAARSPAAAAGLARGPDEHGQADWDPSLIQVPTDDWPAGSYLLRLDADSGAQRYVPVTVRSASTAGKVVIKNCVATWQAYNTWGGYDLYAGPGGRTTTTGRWPSAWTGRTTTTAPMFLSTSGTWSSSPSGWGCRSPT